MVYALDTYLRPQKSSYAAAVCDTVIVTALVVLALLSLTAKNHPSWHALQKIGSGGYAFVATAVLIVLIDVAVRGTKEHLQSASSVYEPEAEAPMREVCEELNRILFEEIITPQSMARAESLWDFVPMLNSGFLERFNASPFMLRHEISITASYEMKHRDSDDPWQTLYFQQLGPQLPQLGRSLFWDCWWQFQCDKGLISNVEANQQKIRPIQDGRMTAGWQRPFVAFSKPDIHFYHNTTGPEEYRVEIEAALQIRTPIG